MSDFNEQRDQLLDARAKKEQARLELFQAREQVKKIEGEQAQFDRVFDSKNQEHIARRRQLERSLADARATVKERQVAYDRFLQVERDAFVAFTPFTDPRETVNQLSDEYPFLLLPVRIETRFKTVIAPGAGQLHQLWVRVFPDDCAVDSFEPMLSEAEIKNAHAYLADLWRAGGIEEQERGAWRGLVASHGSGRAAWILKQKQCQPLNQKPTRANKKDIVLVISTTEPLIQKEEEAAIVFWKAIWLSDGDKKKDDDARDALEKAVGKDRATVIIKQYRPLNLEEAPAPPDKKSDVAVQVAFLILPKPNPLDAKQRSWTQAPKTSVLPDCFVLIGYLDGNEVIRVGAPVPSPLVVGPDPSAPKEEQLRQENGELIVSEEMKWMVDFDRAVGIGMGFRINLSDEQARRGFDRLLVLGLRLSADAQQGRELLETLLEHHQISRTGFSLLPQGAPTNNTERAGSGFTSEDDADESFDNPDKESLFEETTDWFLKSDGQWLAEALGINPGKLMKTRGSGGKDQCEARAMNVALWPATLGYSMETMMHPVFEREETEATRWFFNRFISGRGITPPVRIGSQPYGILPTTVFSRTRWPQSESMRLVAGLDHPANFRSFIGKLHSVLGLMEADWAAMSKNASFVGKAVPPGLTNDPGKTLLDILGLHPASVEFHQRYVESLQQLFNRLNLSRLGEPMITADLVVNNIISGMQLLGRLGYHGQEPPDALQKFFFAGQNLLFGPVIDDRPLSETEAIRGYTPKPDEKNYIKWLVDAARSSLETVRRQQGFTDDKAPAALLYILLRYALLQSYWQSSLSLHLSAQLMTPGELKATNREPNFVHVKDQAQVSESRWRHLYKTEPAITNSNTAIVADFIPGIIGLRPETNYLREQIEALEHLQDTPTARLERLFAEHIDCCSYRWDAWQLGLVHYQLAAMRYRLDHGRVVTKRGVYLGAYGWLEDVRPENKPLSPKSPEPELDKIFNKPGDPPLVRDASNQGYIHAPSLNQAVTAAVLRTGYLSNATPSNPQTLAVNLSSERVRVALSVLEGIRNGQSLAALLGYQLERGLHDRHGLAEVDKFILPMRKAFPLVANRINRTNAPFNAPIQALEARNVIDGLALVNHVNQVRNTPDEKYPYGKSLLAGTNTEQEIIDQEVNRLVDIHDAVADLALAEGVHQAVLGNYDRAAATLDAYSKASFPSDPDVVRTPRSGISLTHRVALHLESGLEPNENDNPRAMAEPALNKWLAGVLPAPGKVACQVTIAGAQPPLTVTQQDLQLQPIDLLFLVQPEGQPAMTELDDRVLRYVHQTSSPRPDAIIEIKYIERPAGKISFFELAALAQSLRALALRSRPLRATDLALQIEARQAQEADVSADDDRVRLVIDSLDDLPPELNDLHAELKALFDDLANNRDQIVSDIDSFISRMVDLLELASRHGIPQTGWGFAFEFKQRVFSGLLKKVDDLVARWNGKLDEFDNLMAGYDALPTDPEKFELLQRAERLISTIPASLAGLTLDQFKTLVLDKKTDFANKLGDFKVVLSTTTKQLSTLLLSLQALLPISKFDAVEFKLDDAEDQIVSFASDLMSMARSLADNIGKKLNAAQEQLTVHDNASQKAARVEALQRAAKILLGDDFQFIPEFGLGPKQADELEKAVNDSRRDKLLRYQTGTLKTDFPVDDWLYGLARVREKMRHWEQMVFLSLAFGKAEPAQELTPIQLPYKAGDHWLGLEFPPEYEIESERLLYTAHYAKPFAKTAQQCGLLLDEWVEVVPRRGKETGVISETTGVAFHYDRPNSEPPQVWLLVTPPDFDGSWHWQDLVDALNETLEMAKKRAVEPAHVDATVYARFLPATVMAVTLYQISIAANLAINNNVFEFIGE